MNLEVEEQSLNPTSSIYAMPSEKPPQLFWDLEQKKDGKGWDNVAEMRHLPDEYQIAACFLANEDKKKYAPLVFTNRGRFRKKYKKLEPFNEEGRKWSKKRAREARKNIVHITDFTKKDDNQKAIGPDFTTSNASTSLALRYGNMPTPEIRTEITDSADTSTQSQADVSTELILQSNRQKTCARCHNFKCCTYSRCQHSWFRCCQCQEWYHTKCERSWSTRRVYDLTRCESGEPSWECMKCSNPIMKKKKRRAASISISISDSLSSDSDDKEDDSQLTIRDTPYCELSMQLGTTTDELGRLDIYDDLSSDFVMPFLSSLDSSIDQLIRDVELGQLVVKAKEGKCAPFEELSILSEHKNQQDQQRHPLVSVLREMYGIGSGRRRLRTRVNRLDETKISARKLFKLVVVYLLHRLVFSSSPFNRSKPYIKAVNLLKKEVKSLGSWERRYKLWMYRSGDDFHAQLKRESTGIIQEMENILSPLAEFFGDEKIMRPGLEGMVYSVAMFNARLKAESNTVMTTWAATGAQYDGTLHKKVNNLKSDQVLYTARMGVFTKGDDGEIITYAPAKLEMYSREDRI